MKSGKDALSQLVENYRKWDFAIFALLTLLSVYSGQTTVFYLIYLFWWNELIHMLIDRFFYRNNRNAVYTGDSSKFNQLPSISQGLFLMGIYGVFILVFFGFIAGWSNEEILFENMRILVFQNWFFNSNLIIIALERWYLHQREQALEVNFNAFSPGRLVLHVSIILGGVLMFFVVKPYPEIFSPENLLGSVVIVLPFLLLRMGMQYLMSPTPKAN